ncbi:MAG: hypothetical protein H6706_03940 [Myxococcales bacterium]|nr:hypothetical protein [Myxococcales bacterium]
MHMRWVVLLALGASGCIGEFPGAPGFDAGADARAMDQGQPDARDADAAPRDGGPQPDAARSDAARPDAARPDAAGHDAAMQDAAPPADAGDRDMAPPADAGVQDAVVVPDGCAPMEEICNGLDDDCNGRVDDLAVLASACQVPGRDCVGVLRCDVERQAVVCEPRPGAVEACNGDDDDCDGDIDEGDPGGGGACRLGSGICEAAGRLRCAAGRLACDAMPGAPQAETCNGLDDDCNGLVDDAPGVGAACSVGVGACVNMGENICRMGSAVPVCSASPGPAADETCNGRDDDCDGLVDNVPGVGTACTVGQGRCAEVGVNTCLDGALRCNARPGVPMAEDCDGADNDCDGQTDEGATCAEYALSACRGWLGWAGGGIGAQRPVRTWGDCPAAASDNMGSEHCVASRGDGLFGLVTLYNLADVQGVDASLGAEDALGLALTCDGGRGAVDAWIQGSCRLMLAHLPAGLDDVLEPADCQDAVSSRDAPGAACVHSGGDGAFHPLWLGGPTMAGDGLAVALRCDAPGEDARARGIDGNVGVALALLNQERCAADPILAGNGIGCDGQAQGARCVDSAGDRALHGFQTAAPLDCHSILGIALVPIAP